MNPHQEQISDDGVAWIERPSTGNINKVDNTESIPQKIQHLSQETLSLETPPKRASLSVRSTCHPVAHFHFRHLSPQSPAPRSHPTILTLKDTPVFSLLNTQPNPPTLSFIVSVFFVPGSSSFCFSTFFPHSVSLLSRTTKFS